MLRKEALRNEKRTLASTSLLPVTWQAFARSSIRFWSKLLLGTMCIGRLAQDFCPKPNFPPKDSVRSLEKRLDF